MARIRVNSCLVIGLVLLTMLGLVVYDVIKELRQFWPAYMANKASKYENADRERVILPDTTETATKEALESGS